MIFPPPLTDKEIQELLPKLIAGDKEAKERIITGYMRLAASIANKYGDDHEMMYSAAWCGVCTVIDRVIKKGFKEPFNLTGLVIYYIHRFCKEELPKNKNYEIFDVPGKNDDLPELLDLIDSLIKDDIERKIINLRIEGLVDTEIAKMLNLPFSTVNRKRKALEQRFLTWRKNHGN